MTIDTLPTNLLNEQSRREYLDEQMRILETPNGDDRAVHASMQTLIEAATSLKFGEEDRAALQNYLIRVTTLYREGKIDSRTAQVDLNKVLMAAAANSPDVLHYIHMEA